MQNVWAYGSGNMLTIPAQNGITFQNHVFKRGAGGREKVKNLQL